MSYLHNYYCNYHSGPVPALILEFGFFWLILNVRLAYFGPEDLATLRSIRAMTYRRMLYIFAIIKRNPTSKCTCLVSWEKHTHMITSKWNQKPKDNLLCYFKCSFE